MAPRSTLAVLVLVICPASSLLGRRFRARERSLLSKIEEQDSTIAHLKTVELTLLDQLRQQRLRAHEAHKGMRELRAHTHRNLATRAEIEANATARVEAAEKSLEDRIAAALEFERSKTEQARAEYTAAAEAREQKTASEMAALHDKLASAQRRVSELERAAESVRANAAAAAAAPPPRAGPGRARRQRRSAPSTRTDCGAALTAARADAVSANVTKP